MICDSPWVICPNLRFFQIFVTVGQPPHRSPSIGDFQSMNVLWCTTFTFVDHWSPFVLNPWFFGISRDHRPTPISKPPNHRFSIGDFIVLHNMPQPLIIDLWYVMSLLPHVTLWVVTHVTLFWPLTTPKNGKISCYVSTILSRHDDDNCHVALIRTNRLFPCVQLEEREKEGPCLVLQWKSFLKYFRRFPRY